MKVIGKYLIGAGLLFSALSTNVYATPLDVGVWGGGGCCDFGVRGYWFTAPTDFTITGLSVPTNGPGDGATLEVLLFDATPPQWSGTTNNFTQLGFWSGTTSTAANIVVSAGDILGILGYADGITPYRDTRGDYATTLGGFDISLQRLGFQSLGTAQNVWREANGPIGVIGLDYTIGAAVPEPATLALFGIGLAGLGFARKKKKSA